MRETSNLAHCANGEAAYSANFVNSSDGPLFWFARCRAGPLPDASSASPDSLTRRVSSRWHRSHALPPPSPPLLRLPTTSAEREEPASALVEKPRLLVKVALRA